MNQLFPIIRRVRRPLLVSDTPPVMVGSVEPVTLNAECEPHGQPEKLVNKVSGETPNTTGETVAAPLAYMPPADKSDATIPTT